MQAALIVEAKKDFEIAIGNAPEVGAIQHVRAYTREVSRTKFDIVSFARAAFITASVATIDPDEYLVGPYPEFAALAETFTMSGGFPSNISEVLAPVVSEFARAESKFKALKEALL